MGGSGGCGWRCATWTSPRSSSASACFNAKLLAFAVSSFYVGVAGALMVFLWLGAAEPAAFDINLSFQILFIIIIGGLGSIVGAFFGATVMHLMPIALRALPPMIGLPIEAARVDQLTTMITGDPDHRLSHRRAARPGSAVADLEAEAARLAVPVLNLQENRRRKRK